MNSTTLIDKTSTLNKLISEAMEPEKKYDANETICPTAPCTFNFHALASPKNHVDDFDDWHNETPIL